MRTWRKAGREQRERLQLGSGIDSKAPSHNAPAGEAKAGGSSLEQIAEESRKKREKDEAEYKEQMKAGLLVNDTIDFVRNFQVS